jgi:hypothetical protein
MNMTISTETRIDGYEAMMEANASLMDEVFNDAKLTAAEKMKTFSIGVRNQVLLSRDLAARRAELFKYGMKGDAALKSLTFSPLDTEKREAA